MPREALRAVALALVLVGCVAPTTEIQAESLPIALPSISFGDAIELPMVPGIGGGEPNIAALPDGTLFVVAPTGIQAKPNALESAAYLWRSTDGGATWQTLRAPRGPIGPFCSCDADVVASPDGWVYVSDWWDGNYMVEASNDGGETWQASPITTINAAVLLHVDRQWLVAGPDGFVALFYSHYPGIFVSPGAITNDLEPLNSGINVVISSDHGRTWSAPKAVLSPAGSEALQIAHARLAPDGTLVMPYALVDATEDFWTDPSKVMLAISRDKGESWESVEVADAPEGFDNLWAVQADVDAAGGIHVGWAARIDKDRMGAYVASSKDGGATWSEPMLLRGEGLNFLPWVAATGNGTVAMGWYGGDDTGDPVKAKGDWFAYVAVSREGRDFVVEKVSETPVKTGALCPRGSACDGDRELLDYVALTFDAAGALHYAFARSENDIALTLVASALPMDPIGGVVP